MENPFEEINKNLIGINKMLSDILDEFKKEKDCNISSEKEDFLSRNEVCNLLQITPKTLYNWGAKGILMPTKIGSRIIYNKSEINEILLKSKFKYIQKSNDNTTPNY
jgi:predicted DNA-binding transcriptional regulator AlpA